VSAPDCHQGGRCEPAENHLGAVSPLFAFLSLSEFVKVLCFNNSVVCFPAPCSDFLLGVVLLFA
jgi:hypothetical protein